MLQKDSPSNSLQIGKGFLLSFLKQIINYLTRRWGSMRSDKIKGTSRKNLPTEGPLGQISKCSQKGKGP